MTISSEVVARQMEEGSSVALASPHPSLTAILAYIQGPVLDSEHNKKHLERDHEKR